ncbi:MAG: rod shape-determining protein MreC [Patescibacteria group bacterium]
MKTPFSRTRRRNALLAPSGGIALLIVAVLIIILFILRTVFPGTISFLARPFWSAGGAVTDSAGGVSAFFGDKAVIAEERDARAREAMLLREQNAVLAARVSDLERLLGGRTEAVAGIRAGVLVRPPVSPYDTLVVDQGTEQGVRVGAQVTGAGGAPIGMIESVAGDTSRVLLYSAPGHVTQGWVGEARIPLSLEGASAGAYRTSVPRENTVAVGETVYLVAGGAVPIGTVVAVDADPSTPRSVIHVRPIVNPFSITEVLITP